MANDNEKGIPLSYIVEYAKAQPTQAKRQAFVNLIRFWADNGGDLAEAIKAILEIQGGQLISANSMPREFMPYYRSETIAVKLIDIIRKIDEKIASKERWCQARGEIMCAKTETTAFSTTRIPGRYGPRRVT